MGQDRHAGHGGRNAAGGQQDAWCRRARAVSERDEALPACGTLRSGAAAGPGAAAAAEPHGVWRDDPRPAAESRSTWGRSCPTTGQAAKGFDNAAETLFLSPLHAEKYLEAAKEALDYASKDPRSRRRCFPISPVERASAGLAAATNRRRPDPPPTTEAARAILEKFLPRAFRRPAARRRSRAVSRPFRGGPTARRAVRSVGALRPAGRADLAALSVSAGGANPTAQPRAGRPL